MVGAGGEPADRGPERDARGDRDRRDQRDSDVEGPYAGIVVALRIEHAISIGICGSRNEIGGPTDRQIRTPGDYVPPVPRESLGPRFQKVWAASAISLVGDGLILSAMPLLIAGLTDSKALVSGLEVARGLPWLFFGLIGGVVADRADRRRVMAVVDAGRCAAVGVLAIAVWQDHATVGLIWVVAFLLGSGEVFFDNSAQSILPSLVDDASIERANARFFITENVARDLAGPALGAALFARAASLPFALD